MEGNFKEGLQALLEEGTVIWICSAVLGIAFGMACYMLNLGSMPYKNILMIISGIAFPDHGPGAHVGLPRDGQFFREAVRHCFQFIYLRFYVCAVTLIAAVFYGIAVFLFLRFLATRLLVILFGPTVVVYCTLVLFEKVFQKYKKKE